MRSGVIAIHVHGAVPSTIPATRAGGRQSRSARRRAATITASTPSGTATSVVTSTYAQRPSCSAIIGRPRTAGGRGRVGAGRRAWTGRIVQ
ncbi:MAG: hypothetical protein HOV79_02515 [Hamadaea sp.]|nr:hypothetical protein [Hamadaea sp.]